MPEIGQGLPDEFCKNTGHFVNSARPRSKFCRNSLAAQGKQRQCVLLSHNLPLFWLAHLHFGVCVT